MRATQPASSSVTCTPHTFGSYVKDKLRNTSFRSILQFSALAAPEFMLNISDQRF